MNGGRLSDDAAFTLGLQHLRAQFALPEPDAMAADRALTMIATRYPEQAEQLRELLSGSNTQACENLLADIESQHIQDSEE